MSQYNLSRPKKKRSKIPFFIVLSFFALSAGAIAAYLTQSKSPAVTLSSVVKIIAEPTSSLNAVRERARDCTVEARDAFVKDANRINEVFEDNFVLAGGTSRIALAPIVANMQGATRDLKALPVDVCGKIVQEKLATAYDDAVDMYLEFMKEIPNDAGVDSVNGKLQDAYRFLFVYQSDLPAPFILEDLLAWMKNEEEKLSQPPEFAYLNEITSKSYRCDDYDFLLRLTSDSYAASINHYNVSKYVSERIAVLLLTPTPALCNGATWLDTPTPTITPTPTVTQTPTPTPSPTQTAVPRTMQFRIDSKNSNDTYSIEYQIGDEKLVVADNVGSTWEHTFISTRGVQLLFRVIDRERSDPASCVIVADGEILSQKEMGEKDKSVTCTATVPYP